MNAVRNYQKELDELLLKLDGKKRLLIHACCAPCSSYCLEYLCKYFDITVLFYNPNIAPEEEYNFRAEELKRLIREYEPLKGIEVVVCDYDENEFLEAVKGLEKEPERGSRCTVCYRLRMEKAAEYAASNNFDYFTTTLSLSPYKDAVRINEIGEALAKTYKVDHLVSDFKKRNGYKRSIELSKEFDLYRQNYCGCKFSKRE